MRKSRTLASTWSASWSMESISRGRWVSSTMGAEAVRACATSLLSSERMALRSRASWGFALSTGDSRVRQSVAERTERTEEMTQAVDGWKCATRLARTALRRSEMACKMGSRTPASPRSTKGVEVGVEEREEVAEK